MDISIQNYLESLPEAGRHLESGIVACAKDLNLAIATSTIREFIHADANSLEPIRKSFLIYVRDFMVSQLKQSKHFTLRDISEHWVLVECTQYNSGDNLRLGTFYPELCKFDKDIIADPRRDDHEVLVISGESGSGKTFSAVHRLPSLLLQGLEHEKLFVFYCCRDPEVPDLSSMDTKEDRDSAAFKQLQEWWDAGWNKVLATYPQLNREMCAAGAAVVMVLDELGNRPNLLRGLIASAADFERSHTAAATAVAPVDSSSDMVVKQFRLICVGTGLDWAVGEQGGTIASDSKNFCHIQLQQWTSKEFRHYAEKRCKDKNEEESSRQAVVKELMVLQLSSLGSNARCAKFLLDTLLDNTLKHDRIFHSISPRSELFTMRSDIFRDVANRYAAANGIGKLFRDNPHAATELLSAALRLAYAGKVPDAADDEQARKLLIYGVLHYKADVVGGGKLCMSPAMLLLLLSRFGKSDLAVLDGEGFEHLVALRELGRILRTDARAKVVIIRLENPIPPSVANTPSLKNNYGQICRPVLPSEFFHPSNPGDLSIKRVYEDAYYIIVNGPKAPFVDVIVLPPVTSMELGLQIQAKKYVNGYNPSVNELDIEARNFGLCPKTHRASYMLKLALFKGHPVRNVFVLSCESGNLHTHIDMSTLKGLVDVEVVHPLWQSLILDRDPSFDQHQYTIEMGENDSLSCVTSCPVVRRRNNSDSDEEAIFLDGVRDGTADEADEEAVDYRNSHHPPAAGERLMRMLSLIWNI